MQKKSMNTKPFRRLMQKLNRKISKKCVEGRGYDNRCWYVAAWVSWLLFDFRNAPHDRKDFRSIDPYTVNRYKGRMPTKGFGREVCEEPPLNWVEASLEVLVAEEIVLSNGKTGLAMRLKPSNVLKRFWDAALELEGQYNPYSNDTSASVTKLTKDVKRLQAVVRELCSITGCELQV